MERSPVQVSSKECLNPYWQALKDSPSLRLHATLYSWSAKLFSPGFVLDLGCEYGFGSLLTTRVNPRIGVVGMDLNLPVLLTAQSLALAWRVHLVCGRASLAPFKSSCLSGVCAINILHQVNDRRAVLAEIERMLKPVGIALIANTQEACMETAEAWEGPYVKNLVDQVFQNSAWVDRIHGQPPGLGPQSFDLAENSSNWAIVAEK